MPNLYLENGKSEVETGRDRGLEVYAKSNSCVCDEPRTEVSARCLDCLYRSRVDERSRMIAIVTSASVVEVWARLLYRRRRGPCCRIRTLW